MDEKPFKFRYASHIAGSFVLLALGLAVVGVVLAGRSKGWFEGKIELRATFPSGEGTFGLTEGSEVLVRNTVAGRVEGVEPNQAGRMEATLVVRRSFQQFVTEDSVARVKKKFGVAGDTFLEIETGTGTPLLDGDTIRTQKDEAVMDTAQQVLEEVERVIIPMLDEIKDILHHLNLITGGIEEGRGIAGAVLKDDEIVGEVKTSIDQVQTILDETRVTVAEVRKLATDPQLTRDIRGSLRQARGLIEESQQAVHETTRLIRGVQKHWLLRKYIEQEPRDVVLAAPYLGARYDAGRERELRDTLERARLANDAAAIALAGARLAAVMLGRGQTREAGGLVQEAKAEAAASRRGVVGAALAEAWWQRAMGRTHDALRTASSVLPALERDQADLWVLAHLLVADLYLDDKRPADADALLEGAARRIDDGTPPVLLAMEAHVRARLALAREQPQNAAGLFDREADHLRLARAYRRMAEALHEAGRAWESVGRAEHAADRYFRAARSRLADGDAERAADLLEQARKQAAESGSTELLSRIGRLAARLALPGGDSS